jgi:RHS repeat-associated protein
MNEYTAVGADTLTYTDNGALKEDATFKYKYDAHDHLIEVRLASNNDLVAEYFYDAVGLGRRWKKDVDGGPVTRFIYADQQSVEELDGSNDLVRLFVFGERIDQVLMMEAADVADVDSDSNTSEVLRFTYHTQLIGSVTHVTGPAQSVVESYLYDPYGKPTINDSGDSPIGVSAIGNQYLFTGRQLDEETGLFYYRARHYSPELKRFVQRDPMGYHDGPNAYAYVQMRSTALRDPLGLYSWKEFCQDTVDTCKDILLGEAMVGLEVIGLPIAIGLDIAWDIKKVAVQLITGKPQNYFECIENVWNIWSDVWVHVGTVGKVIMIAPNVYFAWELGVELWTL